MKPFGKWILVVITLSGSFFLLGGCGYKDIDKRFFVVSVGIDPAKGHLKKYLVSLKFAIPNVEKKPNDFIIVSEEADTMAEAVRIIKTKVDKEVDFSQAKAVVFSQNIVKPNFPPHLYYWLTRRRDFQEISWVVIGKPSALDVLKVKPKFEQVPSNALFLTLGTEGSETPYIIPEFLFDLKKRFSEKGLDPFMPIVEAKKDLLEVNTVGIFNKKEMKIVLKPEETKYLNFFLLKEGKSAIRIHQGKEYFLIDTNKVKTSYKLDTANQNHPMIKVKVKIKGRLEESLMKPLNSKLSDYEKTAEKDINKSVKKLLVKLQKENVDPIGFGLHYRGRHFSKNDWQTWQQLYPNVTYKVITDVQIEDTGLIE
ncbi:Ger(x)C family spore germination protein [Neobacillus sp. PS3-40]|uniref:Ger(x)C family spore germination protein n=1 Tax=Neobacillus sp. PS3-40 TaxID=3070679 RepID=UPI0027DEC4FC|nr:Ger(x)C family spore germination protein [Neobacillus sp. PS3-40]WML44164.1 Ger(x)C family spore germination protein [Neobacillus sp. PS3-40]